MTQHSEVSGSGPADDAPVAKAPVRVLAAVDKFKGTLTAAQVAEHLAAGIRAVRPDAEVHALPIADGGEGTVEAALAAGYERVTVTVTGPTGQPVEADFAIRESESIAVIEMASASGLGVLPGGTKAPLLADSRGTGDLIAAALDRGCRTVVLGIGGSAGTDGGAGMLQALGAHVLDADGRPVGPGGAALASASSVDLTDLDARIDGVEVILASDVDNPLTGSHGAAAVYGPQKGATPGDVDSLDAAMAHWATLLEQARGGDAVGASERPGAGAAGGVGFGASVGLRARFRPGVDEVLDLVGFDAALDGVDLVITGEGSLDAQSLHGKAPVGVARRAGDVPVVAVAGVVAVSPDELAAAGIDRAYALSEVEPDLDRCLTQAGAVLEELAAVVARDWLTGPATNEE